MFVLTMMVNDYEQHGEYYITAWKHEPTDAELLSAMKADDYMDNPKIDLSMVRDNKGRIEPYDINDCWFYLREIK